MPHVRRYRVTIDALTEILMAGRSIVRPIPESPRRLAGRQIRSWRCRWPTPSTPPSSEKRFRRLAEGHVQGLHPAPVLLRERPRGIELDIDTSDLLHDAGDVCVDGAVIESVDSAECARLSAAQICFARCWTFALVRPARNTSAYSRTNSLATAALIAPPAPKTAARFRCKI